MFKEFKEFAVRENVVDMAVGIVIGAAFAVFLVIKGINHMKREKEAPLAEPTTKECPFCFTAIPIQASRCPHCTSQLAAA